MTLYSKSRFIFFLLLFLLPSCQRVDSNRMILDLGGFWEFKFSEKDSYADSLQLPGTTDLARKGILNTKMDETDNLSRIYKYVGKAWYRKTVVIPEKWNGKEISLYMERTKPSQVYVDGISAGSSTDISTPQIYDLTRFLTPGKHVITVVVDNGTAIPSRILKASHMYAESTQTNWNGIIGDFYLEANDKCNIGSVDVYTDIHKKTATVKVKINGSRYAEDGITVSCSGRSWNTPEERRISRIHTEMVPGDSVCSLILDLGEDALLWSEFHPALYKLSVEMKSGSFRDAEEVVFGLREFRIQGKQFVINDKITFLRGKHEGCVFPLHGHTAMDLETWRHHFRIAKQYGINHYRFHSWCPPEACFEAADLEGIYLQPETPYWGTIREKDTVLVSFLTKEGVNIRKAYSNHASYTMFGLGNELSGPGTVRKAIMDEIRKDEDRHLYSFGSNNGCGYIRVHPEEDYYTSCRIGGPYSSHTNHARASFAHVDAYDGGRMNHEYPNTQRNFDTAVTLCPKPIISHETGQYQIYPNYEEMEKYTGILEPRNFAVFKKRLEDAGMGAQAKDFFLASGKWAVELYLAEIEMDLRTKNFGGFQLLDLQDYPGQGSAYVGILDAFMDSKGLVRPEEWRQSCCEVVPLFEASSYTHYADRGLRGKVTLANYSENDLEGKLLWTLRRQSGETLDNGTAYFNVKQGNVGLVTYLEIDISKISRPEKCMLVMNIDGTPYKNDYPVWIYPAEINTTPAKDIMVTDQWDASTVATLKKGGKVLWFPTKKYAEKVSLEGLFITDFWNYKMFLGASTRAKRPVSPGTLGLLVDPQHPLFKNFPTECHTNWQWFPIVKEGYPMILDTLPDSYMPIIQVIDNIERNHKLGLLYEFNVEGGKLLVCMSDLKKYSDKPEVRQFMSAMLAYMESANFNPEFKIKSQEVKALFRP